MLRVNAIGPAKARIVQLFMEQCRDGAQSKSLTGQGALACGQFLREPTLTQRGIHGTAAAIRVLATQTGHETRRVTAELIHYVEHRREFELAGVSPQERVARAGRIDSDDHNVIKIGELLYALAFVPNSTANKENLVSDLANRLIAARSGDKGWSYFTDQKGPAEPLPTAYAVIGLGAHSYDVSGPINFLRDALAASTSIQADAFVQCACLYALLKQGSLADRSTMDAALTRLWAQLERLLNQDLEANIGYARGDENSYVRVPWQLYLLMVVIDRRLRYFASAHSQQRLTALMDAAASPSGFSYPHSGPSVSSRTSGILFELIQMTEAKLPDVRRRLRPLYWGDAARVRLGSRAVSIAGASIAVLFTLYVFILWLVGRPRLSEVAPELVAAAVIILLSGRKRA